VIACILIPFFAAAIERTTNAISSTAPLIIHAGEKVLAVSSEALEVGVQTGFPLRKARALCPEARLVTAEPSRYRYAFGQVMQVLLTFTHLVEPETSAWLPVPPKRTSKQKKLIQDTASTLSLVCYLDLEKLRQKQAEDISRQIITTLRDQLGLTVSVGLAKGKFPARLAAITAAPGAQQIIAAGKEAEFIAPLPITLLPIEVEIARRLRLLGIQTLDQLAGLPVAALSNQFGKAGLALHRLASGADLRPIIPYRPGRVARVEKRLDGTVSNRLMLEAVLRALAEELAIRLHQENVMARSLELTLHLETGRLAFRRLTLRQPAGSTSHFAGSLNQLLSQLGLRSGVNAIEVSASDLVPRIGQQLELFTHHAGREKRLYDALQDAVSRYGAECFYWIKPKAGRVGLPERSFQLQRLDVA
jgi:DNA polymerase IV